jgi:hypothetical protein
MRKPGAVRVVVGWTGYRWTNATHSTGETMPRPRKTAQSMKLTGDTTKGQGVGLAETVSAGGAPLRPNSLTPIEVAIWDSLLESMPAGFFTAADSVALLAYTSQAATLHDIRQRKATAVDMEDFVTLTALEIRCTGALVRLSGGLGFDPASRGKLPVHVAAKKSKFAGLLGAK